MSRNNFNCRLRLEQLEGRDTPAMVGPTFDWPTAAGEAVAFHAASDHSKASDAIPATGDNQIAVGEIDQVPLRVSLTAVIVIALGVGWDRHVRERRPALRGRFTQMLSAS
jgi:hypothetical protein